MRKKQKSLIAIADVLAKTTRRAGLHNNMSSYKIWEKWPDITGPSIAQHARPSRWMGKTLVVRVDHPSWMQELSLLKPQMMERIQEAMPRVAPKDIRFEFGELPPLPCSKTSRPGEAELHNLKDDEVEFIDRAAGQIADGEIRDAARRAMARVFGRRR